MYPTMEQVESANRFQLARWTRFLDSPGMKFIGTDQFEAALDREVAIMNRICERFQEMGGMTPEISKLLGW